MKVPDDYDLHINGLTHERVVPHTDPAGREWTHPSPWEHHYGPDGNWWTHVPCGTRTEDSDAARIAHAKTCAPWLVAIAKMTDG